MHFVWYPINVLLPAIYIFTENKQQLGEFMKIAGCTPSGGKLSNDVSQNHKPSKFEVRVEGEEDLV